MYYICCSAERFLHWISSMSKEINGRGIFVLYLLCLFYHVILIFKYTCEIDVIIFISKFRQCWDKFLSYFSILAFYHSLTHLLHMIISASLFVLGHHGTFPFMWFLPLLCLLLRVFCSQLVICLALSLYLGFWLHITRESPYRKYLRSYATIWIPFIHISYSYAVLLRK